MKTFEDIEAMAMNEVIIHSALLMHLRGDASKEQALIAMVIALIDQKNHYYNEALRLSRNSTHMRQL